ncbi:MAG: hypothetical protein NVS9B15_21660 [Acidobacteriaceae bacterium]
MRFRYLLTTLILGFAVKTNGAEVPLVDFAKHPQYRDVKISPDGQYLAATAVIKDNAVLSLIRLSDLKGHNLQANTDSEVAQFWWVGPHQVMYTVGELTGWHDAPLRTGELFVADVDGEHHRQLYGGRLGLAYNVANLLSVLPDDPDHALISRHSYNGANSIDAVSEAYRIDLRKGSTELIAKAPIRNAAFLADNQGNVRIAYGDGTDWQRKVYYRADANTDWKLIFDETKDGGSFLPLAFDRSGENLYVHCDGANHVGGICRWNAATQQITTLWTGSESGPMHLVRTADSKDVFAVASMPDRPKINLLDKSAPEANLLIELYRRFPGQRVTLGTSTRDGSKRIVFVDSDINPGDFYLYDRGKKSVTKLLTRMPWIKPENMAQMEPVKLASRDGLPLHGYLTRPLGKETAKNLPLIVYVHGGLFAPTWD